MIGLVFHITSEDMSATIGHKCNGTSGDYRHFAYMQIRRIPAVTHIKILFVEHAQTKCLYAVFYYISSGSGRVQNLEN